jgi:hypothetical protein
LLREVMANMILFLSVELQLRRATRGKISPNEFSVRQASGVNVTFL